MESDRESRKEVGLGSKEINWFKFISPLSILICLGLSTCFFVTSASASFGPQVVVSPVEVKRIYQGIGPTYVTFSGAVMPGCANNGGYLKPSWPLANGGVVEDEYTDRMLSILISAKAQSLSLEVRFTVNDASTGWASCSIHGVYLY